MRSKLHAIAQTFVQEVGADLQHYTFVFPNHRAGLFFRKYLSQHIDKPLFAPRVMTINECFAALSDLQVADTLSLLLRLYRAYKQLHPKGEPLDRFIYWGKMMLADFSEIDNHLVPHVEALFASITDLHAIEERFAYLTDNQRSALSRFWKEFHDSNIHHANADIHQRFLRTWDMLYPLYSALREDLKAEGLAYEGMLHRELLEHWDDIPMERFSEQYVFVGFNALTRSEKELMLRLQTMGRADFYFDYDSPYLRDAQNRASMFMQENLQLFASRYAVSSQWEDMPNTEIQLISVPSTVGEVHEVHRILSEIIPADCPDLTRTAVVLPDEQLLIPLQHAIPAEVKKINVTMGYPLRATTLYTLVAHPEQYLAAMPAAPALYIEQMRECLHAQLTADNSEGVYQITKVLDRLEKALRCYQDIDFTVSDIQQLLKMLTLESTIPYVGEPLDGLQVMGVLETRALDFDNVIITGFNDELYPGRTSSNSYIPYTLRCGFSLPTPDRQNAIFAYNFYRMLSYAKRVWLITNSVADEQHSGEVSRYYYQLKWQYGVEVAHTMVTHPLAMPAQGLCQAVEKDERLQAIDALSATGLTTYLHCPKKFHYKYIEQLKEPAPDESVSASEMSVGNALHAVMEQVYAPYVGKNVTKEMVQILLDWVRDDANWESLNTKQTLSNDVLADKAVRSYVNYILLYDYMLAPFQYHASEKKLEARLQGRKLYGYADRIDSVGKLLRVIDYKTGSTDMQYTTMAEVFGCKQQEEDGVYTVRQKAKPQLLQTMLYSWMLSAKEGMVAPGQSVSPQVYATRRLADMIQTTDMLEQRDEAIVMDEEMQQAFVQQLEALLKEIFDMNIPFVPTPDTHSCTYCAFADLCKI